MRPIELLAPAKDLPCGIAAIDAGADAVYIGAARYGAREAAGNSLEDIAALVRHARFYRAKVCVTLNTLLRDDEIPPALRLIARLHEIGIDGLIIQDPGLLECDLPPIPLIASTQMHNSTPEKVAFLEGAGFQRVILARELDLEAVRVIRRQTSIELECFVHGALCVGYSGQCYLSYALGGRSGNRGQCAQPCRKAYTLLDADGTPLAAGKHLLSLHDLNLADHLGALLDAGISAFKIEGRLKDQAYVANVVSYYRTRLDEALAARGLARSSSGASTVAFTPDPVKTFNRGFTDYFLHGRSEPAGSPETPKMVGETIGRVTAATRRTFTVDSDTPLHPGDGICFFTRAGVLHGTTVNAVHDATVTPEAMAGIVPGTVIHRNRDHAFHAVLQAHPPVREIAVDFSVRETPGGSVLVARDEDAVTAEVCFPGDLEPARQPEAALAALHRALRKCGGTGFSCRQVTIELAHPCHVPVSALNALRREALERLADLRRSARPAPASRVRPTLHPYPERRLDFRGNVLNRQAEAFYRRHGVAQIEPAAETGLDLRGRTVMRTRYCLKHQLGLCPRDGATARHPEPFHLVDAEGHRLRLRFDCARCGMDVILDEPE